MRNLFAVFSILAAMPLAASPALAQNPDGFQWSSIQFNDESNRGIGTSMLTYGVPETDNVLVRGTCVAGSSATSVQVTFGADFGQAQNGDYVQMRFLGEGVNEIRPAVVTIPQSEEGLYGVTADLAFDDPLWSALKRLAAITYSVNGGRFVELGLSGSSAAINVFLDECLFYAGSPGAVSGGQPQQPLQPLQPQQPSQPLQPRNPQTGFDPRWATCDTYANLRSQQSDIPVQVTFTNRSGGYRSVMWVGFDGVPVNYANLNPGESFGVQTYLTHPWMFTDGPGNCIEMFLPQQGVTRFDISAPGRNFGSE